ncbi:hypothetical protein E2H86_19465 [Pseudomonas putida]|uniref:hypothetical protein n=1 Tax=Pseudomonas putida TaxID=303 RepID=UPI00105A53B7|nr:hypothetical protein [Pseudomonas putida]TDJ74765.1 hypothetical protein E2H86_19465 [Pseudomonas putida]
MSLEPTHRQDFEDYLDHEIRTRITGPIKTNRDDPSCPMQHYAVTLAIFKDGQELSGTRENLKGEYADVFQAQVSAFSMGRSVIDRILAA